MDDFEIEIEEDAPTTEVDEHGNIMSIQLPDGSIEFSLDGSPLEKAEKIGSREGWFDNLVEDISTDELSRIAEELMKGVEGDLKSRQEWIEDRAQGIKLLGLKVEIPGLAGAADGAPVEGMSRVRHPLLLEAVLRFQANARSELLPTDGPVKIREDNNNATIENFIFELFSNSHSTFRNRLPVQDIKIEIFSTVNRLPQSGTSGKLSYLMFINIWR